MESPDVYGRSVLGSELGIPLTPNVFKRNLEEARKHHVVPASTNKGLVQHARSTKQFSVSLPGDGVDGSCSCREYQRSLMLCSHACALAMKL